MEDSNKIIKFYPKNAADNPDAVLEQAVGQYNNVLIIGWDKNDIFDARSNVKSAGDLILLVEFFKEKLLRGDFKA